MMKTSFALIPEKVGSTFSCMGRKLLIKHSIQRLTHIFLFVVDKINNLPRCSRCVKKAVSTENIITEGFDSC